MGVKLEIKDLNKGKVHKEIEMYAHLFSKDILLHFRKYFWFTT